MYYVLALWRVDMIPYLANVGRIEGAIDMPRSSVSGLCLYTSVTTTCALMLGLRSGWK